MVCVAGVHGNEPDGLVALQRVFAELTAADTELCGDLVGLAGNLQALARNQRCVAEDLNRVWEPGRVDAVRAACGRPADEAAEQAELDRELRSCIAAARGPVFVLDIHTTSGPGPAFVIEDRAVRNRRFAAAFPVPRVRGLEQMLRATLIEHVGRLGCVGLALEAGQQGDAATVLRGEAAIWLALEAAGLVPDGLLPRASAGRRFLAQDSAHLPRVVDLCYRHALAPGDDFRMRPGFRSFQPVACGEILADAAQGVVVAPCAGLLFMPLYQAQGSDGFFLVQPRGGAPWPRTAAAAGVVPRRRASAPWPPHRAAAPFASDDPWQQRLGEPKP